MGRNFVCEVVFFFVVQILVLPIGAGLCLSPGVARKTELIRFGLIADVQFCDEDDGLNFGRTKVRRYRQSLDTMRKARDSFEAKGIKFAVALGDLFDHKAEYHRERALAKVRSAMGTSITWHLAVGNHDIMAFSREEVRKYFVPSNVNLVSCDDALYYEFTPVTGVKCVVIDAYVQSVVGAAGGQNGLRSSAKYLASHNPNILVDDPARPSSSLPNGWLDGLDTEEYRFVPFNGGLGESQRQWLRDTLGSADLNNEIVFLFTHIPILPQAAKPHNVCWDNTEVLGICDDFPSLRLVVFAGHDHDGGYAVRCPSPRHRPRYHLTPSAPLECDKDQLSFGSVHVSRLNSTDSSGKNSIEGPDDLAVDIQWIGKTPPSWPSPCCTLTFDYGLVERA